MPNPQEIFTVLANDLQAVGIKVNGVPRPWNGGFKDDVQQFGKQDLHILGWTGDYNDPGNFVGTFFGRGKVEFGDQAMTEMFEGHRQGRRHRRRGGQEGSLEQVNRDIAAKWLPAVPVWHAPPAIVVHQGRAGADRQPVDRRAVQHGQRQQVTVRRLDAVGVHRPGSGASAGPGRCREHRESGV